MGTDATLQHEGAILSDGSRVFARTSDLESVPAITVKASPPMTIAALVLVDLLILTSSISGAVFLRKMQWTDLNLQLYTTLWPMLGVFIATFTALRLYPVVAFSPVEELRRTSWGITGVYLGLAAMTFLFKEGENYSRSIFLIAWAITIIGIPVGRAILRWMCASRSWWGVPVIVLGAGKTGHMVVRALLHRPELGLKPVVVLDDDPQKHNSVCGADGVLKSADVRSEQGVPIVGDLGLAPGLAKLYDLKYAIVAMPGVPHERLLQLVEVYADTFTHLIVVPDLFGFSSLRVPAKDLGGILGLEMQQQLLLSGPRFVKRTIDLVLTVVGGICVLPFIALVALWIRLESRGPAFYGHTRIGRGNTRFKAWKFRSMYLDADKMLADYLEKHPELRKEWEETQKLKDDPRVTRAGRFLRKTSLDELPQIWNVLWGEMSLVGPRPIVEAEIPRYENKFKLYLKVRPGITGLWQVSGRSDTTYAQRVEFDTYYVRNWSPWLDAYILARTVGVVIKGKGAY